MKAKRIRRSASWRRLLQEDQEPASAWVQTVELREIAAWLDGLGAVPFFGLGGISTAVVRYRPLYSKASVPDKYNTPAAVGRVEDTQAWATYIEQCRQQGIPATTSLELREAYRLRYEKGLETIKAHRDYLASKGWL